MTTVISVPLERFENYRDLVFHVNHVERRRLKSARHDEYSLLALAGRIDQQSTLHGDKEIID